MRHLSIDIETFSDIDIQKAGELIAMHNQSSLESCFLPIPLTEKKCKSLTWRMGKKFPILF